MPGQKKDSTTRPYQNLQVHWSYHRLLQTRLRGSNTPRPLWGCYRLPSSNLELLPNTSIVPGLYSLDRSTLPHSEDLSVLRGRSPEELDRCSHPRFVLSHEGYKRLEVWALLK